MIYEASTLITICLHTPCCTSPLQLTPQFAPSQVLSSHTGPVTCLAATYPPPYLTATDPPSDLTTTNPPPDLTATANRGREPPTIHTLIASGSSDSSVVIWERKAREGE